MDIDNRRPDYKLINANTTELRLRVAQLQYAEYMKKGFLNPTDKEREYQAYVPLHSLLNESIMLAVQKGQDISGCIGLYPDHHILPLSQCPVEEISLDIYLRMMGIPSEKAFPEEIAKARRDVLSEGRNARIVEFGSFASNDKNSMRCLSMLINGAARYCAVHPEIRRIFISVDPAQYEKFYCEQLGFERASDKIVTYPGFAKKADAVLLTVHASHFIEKVKGHKIFSKHLNEQELDCALLAPIGEKAFGGTSVLMDQISCGMRTNYWNLIDACATELEQVRAAVAQGVAENSEVGPFHSFSSTMGIGESDLKETIDQLTHNSLAGKLERAFKIGGEEVASVDEFMDQIFVRPITTVEGLRETFPYVHRSYRQAGYMGDDPPLKGRVANIYLAMPGACAVAAKNQHGYLLGTIAAVPDSDAYGLPSDGLPSPFFDEMRQKGERLVEIFSLATWKESSAVFRSLLTGICAHILKMEMEGGPPTKVSVAVNPNFVRVYRAMGLSIADPYIYEYERLPGRPKAVLMSLDVAKVLAKEIRLVRGSWEDIPVAFLDRDTAVTALGEANPLGTRGVEFALQKIAMARGARSIRHNYSHTSEPLPQAEDGGTQDRYGLAPRRQRVRAGATRENPKGKKGSLLPFDPKPIP